MNTRAPDGANNNRRGRLYRNSQGDLMPLGSQGVHAGRGRGADGEINVDKQQSSFI